MFYLWELKEMAMIELIFLLNILYMKIIPFEIKAMIKEYQELLLKECSKTTLYNLTDTH